MSADAVPTVEDFNAGRDMAFAYLREAIEADANPPDEKRTHYATGLLAPYLDRLRERPELVAGFDAYLTSILGVLDHSSPHVDRVVLTYRMVYGPDFDFYEDDAVAESGARIIVFPTRTAAGGA